MMRQMWITGGVPAFVDAIDDTRQATFSSDASGQPVQAAAVRLRGDFASVGRADSRHMVRADQPGLEERNFAVKLYPIDIEGALGNCEPRHALLREQTL